MNLNEFNVAVREAIVQFDPAANSIPAANKATLTSSFTSRGISNRISQLVIQETEEECKRVAAATPGSFNGTLVADPAKDRIRKKILSDLIRRYDLATRAIDPAVRQQAMADLKEIGYSDSDATTMVGAGFHMANQEVQSNGGVAPDADRVAGEILALHNAGLLHRTVNRFRVPPALANAPRVARGMVGSVWTHKAIAILSVCVLILFMMQLAPSLFSTVAPQTIPGMIIQWTLVAVFTVAFVVAIVAAVRGANAIWTTLVAAGSLFGILLLSGAMVFSPDIPDLVTPPIVDKFEAVNKRLDSVEESVAGVDTKVDNLVAQLKDSRSATAEIDKELLAAGERMGLGKDPERPKIGTYVPSDLDLIAITRKTDASAIAYLALCNSHNVKAEKTKRIELAQYTALMIVAGKIPESAEEGYVEHTEALCTAVGVKVTDGMNVVPIDERPGALALLGVHLNNLRM